MFCICRFNQQKIKNIIFRKFHNVPETEVLICQCTSSNFYRISIVLGVRNNLEMTSSIWGDCIGRIQILCHFMSGTWASPDFSVIWALWSVLFSDWGMAVPSVFSPNLFERRILHLFSSVSMLAWIPEGTYEIILSSLNPARTHIFSWDKSLGPLGTSEGSWTY